jgi:hypothetical protein
MIYTVYDIETGNIKRVTPINPAALDRALDEGEAAIEGEVDTFIYDHIVDGVPVTTPVSFYPEKHARTMRNSLLTGCDWTQVPDSPLTEAQKEAWRTYRQALRDFPSIVSDCTSEDEVIALLPELPQ